MRPIDADSLYYKVKCECNPYGKPTIEFESGKKVLDWIEKARSIDCFGSWVPVEERLPENCENVLAWIERDAWLDGYDYPIRTQEAAIGWHIDGRWHFDGYAGSTTKCLAWMSLPKPYEVKNNE